MTFIKRYFSMYTHLPKEIYVLAFGRIMTSMGALIWPMLTLIMSNKLDLNGQTIGLYMMIFSMFMVPCNLLGGKLADKYNKKRIIVIFDLIGNSLYFICAMLPISMYTLYFMAIASVFQQMEHPSYDALIADLTNYKDRQRAYSFNYLAMNLGLVLAPTIGGILFNDYLNLAFLINGLADLSSTLLILFFIKNVRAITNGDNHLNEYEKGESGSLFQVLIERKLLFILFMITGISSLIYSQYQFLMPLHLEDVFQDTGAFKFGILTSINAFIVVIGTPVLTKKCRRIIDIKIMYLGQFFESFGLMFFIFLNRYFIIAIIGIVLFTIGEILLAISNTPYLTKRIPETHRGRILAIISIFSGLVGTCSNYVIGILIDNYSFHFVWEVIACISLVLFVIYKIYLRLDKQTYPSLYIDFSNEK